jgi:Smg protein
MFDVLMYLFENYMDDDAALDANQEELKAELVGAGFALDEITKAFDWLDFIARHADSATALHTPQRNAIRVYNSEEQKVLDVKCRGFVLYLEQVGILDPVNRELVIDRAMALDMADFDLDRLKWVVLMVLLNQPGQETHLAWLEDFVLENFPQQLH